MWRRCCLRAHRAPGLGAGKAMGGSRKNKMQRGSDIMTMSTGWALREREGWLGGWVGRGVWEGKKAVEKVEKR